MSHSKHSRPIIVNASKYHDVAEHCRKFGIDEAEERKLKSLLGKHAPLHEIHSNAPPKPPKYR
jgi:hypothetical protein